MGYIYINIYNKTTIKKRVINVEKGILQTNLSSIIIAVGKNSGRHNILLAKVNRRNLTVDNSKNNISGAILLDKCILD